MIGTIKPTNDLLLIRRITNEEPRTASGIYLPPVEDSADTPWRGVVVAAGPGKPVKLSGAGQAVVDALQALLDAYHAMPNNGSAGSHRGISLTHWQAAADAMVEHEETVPRVPMQVKVGDTVVFSRNGFQEYKLDGEVLIACGEASILGVLNA